MIPTRLVIVLCLLLLPGATAHAANIDVVGDLLKEATVQPGGKSEGRIGIVNRSDTAQQVKVYQTDYLYTSDGKSTYGAPGSAARSNASWITIAPKELVIPPKTQSEVYYTIQVPDNKDLSGSYWSVLMVEPVAADVLQPKVTGEGAVAIGMRTISRYAVEIITQIGETGKREIKFIGKRAVVVDGKSVLQLDVANTGEYWLRQTARVDLYDATGAYVGRFESHRGHILPGCSSRCSVDLSGVTAGKYKALVVVDNGDQYVWGAQYDLDIQ